jgi:hypothetical protein
MLCPFACGQPILLQSRYTLLTTTRTTKAKYPHHALLGILLAWPLAIGPLLAMGLPDARRYSWLSPQLSLQYR